MYTSCHFTTSHFKLTKLNILRQHKHLLCFYSACSYTLCINSVLQRIQCILISSSIPLESYLWPWHCMLFIFELQECFLSIVWLLGWLLGHCWVFKWLFAGDYYSAFSLSLSLSIYIYIAWIPNFLLKIKALYWHWWFLEEPLTFIL